MPAGARRPSSRAEKPSRPAPPPTRRVNRGSGHSYLLDGAPVDGVTTVIDDGIPKRALIDWAARVTVEYAEDHWDELVALEKASERRHRLERARWDKTKAAAARGTTVHKLALRLAAGEEVDVPDEISGYVDAYLRFVEEWEPDELLVEVPVFHRTLRYAGTLDLIATLADGWTWLLDWKTGGTGIYPETAVQLAAYRHAEFYLDQDGAERPLPPIDFAGAVWLRADGYDLYKVDAGDGTFRTFQYARQVARFVKAAKARREEFIGESEPPPVRAAA